MQNGPPGRSVPTEFACLFVGTGVLDGPKSNEFLSINNQPVGEAFRLPKTNTHRTQKGETKYLSFSVLFLLQHLFAPSAFAARGAFEVARKACVSRIHRFLIGRHNFGAALFAFVSTNAHFELQCVKTRN